MRRLLTGAATVAAAVILTLAAAPASMAALPVGTLYFSGQDGGYPSWTTLHDSATIIDASNRATYFVDANGQAWSFGNGVSGDLGDGNNRTTEAPVEVTGVTGVTALGNWRDGGEAVTASGTVYAWGNNQSGEFCNGSEAGGATPIVDHALSGIGVTQIAGGDNHVYVLLGDSEVLACGNGALGDGNTQSSTTPVQVALPAHALIEEISASNSTGCALLNPKTVSGTNLYCWGDNQDGQVGTGQFTSHVRNPEPVAGDQTWVAMADGGGAVGLGYGSVIAVNSAGGVYTFGDNQVGQLGLGTTTSVASPTRVTFPADFAGVDLSSVSPLSVGGATMGLVDKDGNLWAWGYTGYGNIGNGTLSPNVLTPEIVATGVSQVSFGNQVSAYLSS